ncbi:hypothetical protein QR680_018399 [Steinernema hermaphroditum]|uniref:m7GpppX diphosphatase n=1 Tax=Steinernema hermaphroditum TaxID=289476 RepID=A0AA39LQA0_9BILA|nr:hypothetical protein QR680_018399 [Steinernema hermaphroditum]
MPSCESSNNNTQVGFTTLEGFSFKEVLNSDITRKSIFVLLEKEGKNAILICDKQPFAESAAEAESWIRGSKMNLLVENDIYGNYEQEIPAHLNGVKTTLIYPATEKHILKYRAQDRYLIAETGDDYDKITLPHILESNLSVQWVYNCLDHKSEQDRLIFEDPDEHSGFQLYPDLKWNGETMENLYCQALVRRRGIKSVRDLTADDIPLLENVLEKSKKAIRERYGVNPAQIKAYFHYQPSFYHLHMHLVKVNYDAPGGSMYAIPVEVALGNLRIASDYYKRATLPFMGKALDPLCQKFKAAGKIDF